PAERGAWYRLSRLVMRRPGRIAIASAAFLVALGIPFWGIKFIQANAQVLPASTTAKQVDDLLAREFPANRTAPLDVVVRRPANDPRVKALATRIAHLPNVSAVAPAQPAGPGGSLVPVA